MAVKKELTELLENAQTPCSRVYLSGCGAFVDNNGNSISPYEILQALYRKQDAIDRGLYFVRALEEVEGEEL